MAKHNETGAKGEAIALEYLRAKHYQILATNWRVGHKEIDILAAEGSILIVIEVKTRSGLSYGFPEESVTVDKQKILRNAAARYMEDNLHFTEARFDVISIMMKNGEVVELVHLEDAFF